MTRSSNFYGLHLARNLITSLARTNKLIKFPDIAATDLSLREKLLNVAFVDLPWNQIVKIDLPVFVVMPIA